jgi:hypothetical protein
MEIWEIACAFGAHRPESTTPAAPAAVREAGVAYDADLAAMIAAAERARATGERPQWSDA